MNSSNFILTGGYPLKSERLQEQQTAYAIFNSLGALAGNFTIISGCALTGTIVGNGVVYINGEVIEFREADSAGTPEVIIIEEPIMKAFKNGVVKQVHTIRYATFGTADTSWLWSNFKRPKTAIELNEQKEDKTTVQLLIDRITELEDRPIYVNPVKNKGYFTLGDITGGQIVGSSLPFSGNCVSAIVAPYIDVGNHYIDVTFSNPMTSINYKVKLFVESLGDISTDNDAGNPIFKVMAVNKFRVGLYEASPTVQSIRIHFEVCEL